MSTLTAASLWAERVADEEGRKDYNSSDANLFTMMNRHAWRQVATLDVPTMKNLVREAENDNFQFEPCSFLEANAAEILYNLLKSALLVY